MYLERVQHTEIEILDVVHSFCVKNNIRYSLAYGTLLGAVRHQGFIPWDDDIDLMMLRSEYDRFIDLWKKNPPEGYFLQTDDTDPKYINNFLKIRKNNTAFIQNEREKKCPYHTGIFIDIFPTDRVAPAGLQRKFQYLACQFNMLMTRNYTSGNKGFGGVIERILLKLPRSLKQAIKKQSYRIKTKYNNAKNNELLLFVCVTIKSSQKYFDSDLFDDFTELSFNGKKYMAFKKYDYYLKSRYGDYMKLPPEKERTTHLPLFIDFEHEYKG